MTPADTTAHRGAHRQVVALGAVESVQVAVEVGARPGGRGVRGSGGARPGGQGGGVGGARHGRARGRGGQEGGPRRSEGGEAGGGGGAPVAPVAGIPGYPAPAPPNASPSRPPSLTAVTPAPGRPSPPSACTVTRWLAQIFSILFYSKISILFYSIQCCAVCIVLPVGSGGRVHFHAHLRNTCAFPPLPARISPLKLWDRRAAIQGRQLDPGVWGPPATFGFEDQSPCARAVQHCSAFGRTIGVALPYKNCMALRGTSVGL